MIILKHKFVRTKNINTNIYSTIQLGVNMTKVYEYMIEDEESNPLWEYLSGRRGLLPVESRFILR